MKFLDGHEVAEFIKFRHLRQAQSLKGTPTLAIVRMGDDAATTKYLDVKRQYGLEIGVEVLVFSESEATILERIAKLNADDSITGIIVQLPLQIRGMVADALAAVDIIKDVDGLAPKTNFETATPKAIVWLLAAYDIALVGKRIAIIGQGRLVGKPLADRLELSGSTVLRLDITTTNLTEQLLSADIIISATGQPGLLIPEMLKSDVVIVDSGAPKSEVAEAVLQMPDIKITPNPGGVGPMTVAALFDNVLIAATQQAERAAKQT